MSVAVMDSPAETSAPTIDPKRLYVAGPMRGIDRFNFPAFDAAAARFRDAGWDVINPADLDRLAGITEHTNPLPPDFLRQAMARDLAAICECDAIALLPNWHSSAGTAVELALAKLLHLEILDAQTMEPYHEPITAEAQRITTRDRRDVYGHPFDDLSLIAEMWRPILGVSVSPEKVAMCMVQLKLAREIYKPKRDNRVDAIGCVNCLQMIVEKREQFHSLAERG